MRPELEPADELLDREIDPEDTPDYHWDIASVDARLRGGEDVFESQFELEVYSALEGVGGLSLVPQWPARGKFIDLVVTDREGRRIAVEADGAQHHETLTGSLIPEDLDRQALLEEAGWTFIRIASRDWQRDAKGQVARLLDELGRCPPNPGLAEKVFGVGEIADVIEDLDELTREGAEALGDDYLTPEDPADEPLFRVAAPDANDPAELQVLVRGELVLGASDEELAPTYRQPIAALDGDAARGDGAGHHVPNLDDLPLREAVVLVTELVSASGPVPDAQLKRAFETHHMGGGSRLNARTLYRFAWTAKGMGYLDLQDETWTATGKAPAEDDRYGDWTFNRIVERAEQLLHTDPDPFNCLLAEVYSGPRVPKLAMSLVGSAINQARRGVLPGLD